MSKKDIQFFQTPIFRISWPSLHEVNEDGKYSVTMLFQNTKEMSDDDRKRLKVIDTEVKRLFKTHPDCKGNDGLIHPLKKQDSKVGKYEGYVEGSLFCEAHTTFKSLPKNLLRRDGTLIEDAQEELQSGFWAVARISMDGYDYKGKQGVTMYLKSLVKMKEDDTFGSGSNDNVDNFDLEEMDPDFGDESEDDAFDI